VDNLLGDKVDVSDYRSDLTETTTGINEAKAAATAAQSDINTHIANKNNPHQVTAAQLGISASYDERNEKLILTIPGATE
jgi:hypothetical protein